MQQRRGTASQWTTADPILAAGELGYETDTGYFKIGDGTNVWSDLSYFKDLGDLAGSFDDYILLTQKGAADGVATLDSNAQIPISQLSNLIQDAPTSLDTLNEIATAVSDPSGVVQVKIDSAISTEVTNRNNAIDNSIENSILVGTGLSKSFDAETKKVTISAGSSLTTDTELTNAISDHNSGTTNVHGISDTSALATKTYADSAVSTHETDTTNIHGIADTAALATKAYTDNAVAGISKSSIGLGDVDNIPSSISADDYTVAVRSTTGSLAATGIELSNTEMVESRISMPFNNGDEVVYATINNQYDSLGGLGLFSNRIIGLNAPTLSMAGSSGDVEIYGNTGIVINAGDGNTVLKTDNTGKSYIQSVASGNEIVKKSELDLKAPIANPTFTGTVSGVTKSMVGLGNVDNTTDANKPVSSATQTALDLKANVDAPTFTGTVVLPSTTSIGNVSATEIGYVDGVTSSIQTQINAKAPLASPTFTGTVNAEALTLSGNLTVQGTTTTVSSTNLELTDSLIYLAAQQYSADAVDIGIYGAYGTSGNNSENHPHTGLIRDASDGKWKLISGGSEPTGNVVDFTSATYDTLKVGAIETTSATIGSTTNTEIGYVHGVTSAIQTQLNAKAPIADPTFTGTVSGITKSMVGLGNVDNTSDANKPVSTAQQTALDLKANLAAPTFTGSVVLPSTTTIGSTTGTELGYVHGLTSAAQTQLDSKLASATASSTYETITNVALKAPKDSPSFTGGVTVDSSGIIFIDGTQVKAGVPSLTTINQQAGAYTTVLADRDKLVEVSNASAVTVTIPLNSSVAYPVGTSIDILQTGAGQVTIAGAAGVTVNATPGLKLRTQWSSATLFKRATDTWVVFGDLSA